MRAEEGAGPSNTQGALVEISSGGASNLILVMTATRERNIWWLKGELKDATSSVSE